MNEVFTKSRKWQLTINNPDEEDLSDEKIKEILKSMKSVDYYCMSHEVGDKGNTPHVHIFIFAKGTIRFNTIKKKFPKAHIEKANGTVLQNKEYIFKEGKWENTEKESTNIKESHFEFGTIPEEKQGKRYDLVTLYSSIKEGKSNFDIVEENPMYVTKLDTMDRVRKLILEEKYKNAYRELDVTYIYGKTGTGKTRGVMEKYGYENVYRVTDYLHPFDNYKQQDIIILEEFRSDLKIGVLLNLLDVYPHNLPCRYADKVACYTKVYIISNISLKQQYKNIQTDQPESYEALTRRISEIRIYEDKDNIKVLTKDEYFGPKEIIDENNLPFKDIPTETESENN